MGQVIRVKEITHDVTFYCTHTINCVCQSIMSMFRVLGIYNFALMLKFPTNSTGI